MATAVTPKTYKNYINGEWVEASGSAAIENRNPANRDELVGMFPSSTAADVNAAVDAANEAYKKWRLVPAPKRAEILFRAAEMLVARKEDFARDMTREMGKVLAETRGDVQEAIDMTYLHGRRRPAAVRADDALGAAQQVCDVGAASRSASAAMITPWNFPMAIPSWKIMPALVCGNTVVIKPAAETPLSTYNLVQILEEAGLPPGVVNVVNGDGPKLGAPLVRHRGRRGRQLHRLDATSGASLARPARRPSRTATWRWAARTSSS